MWAIFYIVNRYPAWWWVLLALDGLPYYSLFIMHLFMYFLIHLFIFPAVSLICFSTRDTWTKLSYKFLNFNMKHILPTHLKLPPNFTISHCLNWIESAAFKMPDSCIFPFHVLWLPKTESVISLVWFLSILHFSQSRFLAFSSRMTMPSESE